MLQNLLYCIADPGIFTTFFLSGSLPYYRIFLLYLRGAFRQFQPLPVPFQYQWRTLLHRQVRGVRIPYRSKKPGRRPSGYEIFAFGAAGKSSPLFLCPEAPLVRKLLSRQPARKIAADCQVLPPVKQRQPVQIRAPVKQVILLSPVPRWNGGPPSRFSGGSR